MATKKSSNFIFDISDAEPVNSEKTEFDISDAEPVSNISSISEKPSLFNEYMQSLKNDLPTLKNTLSKNQDAAVGMMRGAQNLAAGGLEAGEYLTRKGAEALPGAGKVPYWDAREAMGLGKDRPFDFQNYIGSKNPNREVQNIFQHLPGALSGGASLPGMIGANSLNSAAQAAPNQENAMGYLPSGRGGAAIEGGALGAVPYVFGKAFNIAKNLLSPVNPENIAKSVQMSHDALLNSAERGFENVGKEAVTRGADLVPIRKDLISDIEKHPLIPESEKVKDLIDKARSGSFHALRKLQSELFHRINRIGKTSPESDKMAAETLGDLRNEINNSITKNFNQKGHLDLANELNEARNKYRLLQETYFGKSTPRAIKNLVGEDRAIPDNIMDILSKRSESMNRLREQNPLAAGKAEAYQTKKNALKALKYMKIPAAVVGGAIFGPDIYRKAKSIFVK